PAVPLPVPVEASVAELVRWVSDQTSETALTFVVTGGVISRIGIASETELRESDWSIETAEALRPWLESATPKVLNDAKPQVKALLRAGIRLGGLAYDPTLAGWLLRPSFPDKTLAHLVDRYLDEKLPVADPSQLVPETDGATPSQQAWFSLRTATALREALPDSVAA